MPLLALHTLGFRWAAAMAISFFSTAIVTPTEGFSSARTTFIHQRETNTALEFAEVGFNSAGAQYVSTTVQIQPGAAPSAGKKLKRYQQNFRQDVADALSLKQSNIIIGTVSSNSVTFDVFVTSASEAQAIQTKIQQQVSDPKSILMEGFVTDTLLPNQQAQIEVHSASSSSGSGGGGGVATGTADNSSEPPFGGLIDLTRLPKGMSLAELLPMQELRPKAEAELATRRRLNENAEQKCFNFVEQSFMPPFVRQFRYCSLLTPADLSNPHTSTPVLAGLRRTS
jgi:hypothetical protein